MKKALFVGINYYDTAYRLNGCIRYIERNAINIRIGRFLSRQRSDETDRQTLLIFSGFCPILNLQGCKNMNINCRKENLA